MIKPIHKQIIIGIFLGLIGACQQQSEKQKAFCNCLAISEQLNKEASKYNHIALQDIQDEDVETLKKIMREKDSICAPYDQLDAKELIQMREKCQ